MITQDEKLRADMRRLLAAVEEVRRAYPRMELGQLAVLLSVLIEPGLRAQDLTNRVGLQKSSLSRNVKSLSAASYLSDEEGNLRDGLDLITQTPDAVDRRAFQLAPTPKGWTLAEKLSRILKSRPSARP